MFLEFPKDTVQLCVDLQWRTEGNVLAVHRVLSALREIGWAKCVGCHLILNEFMRLWDEDSQQNSEFRRASLIGNFEISGGINEDEDLGV